MARTLETPIQKRFSDVDPFQHVNNVSQQMYFDVGKMEFYEKVLGAEVLRVTTTCERVGTKSLTLFQQLLAGGEVRSESRSVMVVFDFARQRSEPVPDAWRERLLAD